MWLWNRASGSEGWRRCRGRVCGPAPPLPRSSPGSWSRRALLGRPPRMRPARSALGVTSRARSRPAAGGHCTAAPPSRVPGVAGLRAPKLRPLRLPAKAVGAARAPGTERAAPPCGGRARAGGSLSARRLPGPGRAPSAPVWSRWGRGRRGGAAGAVGGSGRRPGSALGTRSARPCCAEPRTHPFSHPWPGVGRSGGCPPRVGLEGTPAPPCCPDFPVSPALY